MASEQSSPARREQDSPARREQDMPLQPPVDLQRVIAEQERIFKQRQPGSAGLA